MMSLVLFEKIGSLAWVTFNCPEQYNAMGVEMGEVFSKLMDQIAVDAEIRVVILTGAGKAFSSGGNLDMLLEKTKKSNAVNQAELKKFYKMFLKIREIPQPTIAMINGPAVGAGFCLSLACDLKYAADSAKMGANFARLGLAPGMGGTYLVTRLAGPVAAAEILLTGDVFSAAKALQYGIINEIFSLETLRSEVTKRALQLAQNAPLAIKQIKKGIQLAQNMTLEESFNYDSACQALCFESKDLIEGVQAIKEKRPPQFKGA